MAPNSVMPDRLNRTDRWILRCFVLQSWRVSLCSKRFAPCTKQWVVGACRPWQLFKCATGHLSDSVAIKHPVLYVKKLHSGAQYPWSDTKDTLISDLNKQSVGTEDTSVQINLNHISNHLTMWFGSNLQITGFMWFFAVQTSWNQPGYNLDMTKIQFWLVVWTRPICQ